MCTLAEELPTAAVVASRDSVATAGEKTENVQPLVTLVSKPVLVMASGALPTHSMVRAGASAWPSQPVWIWDWLDWPVARSTAYSSYHQSWYGARLTSLPGAKAATPLPSA